MLPEEVHDESAFPPLPPECEEDKYPVVVLQNVYTREEADADPNFFDDLEVRRAISFMDFEYIPLGWGGWGEGCGDMKTVTHILFHMSIHTKYFDTSAVRKVLTYLATHICVFWHKTLQCDFINRLPPPSTRLI